MEIARTRMSDGRWKYVVDISGISIKGLSKFVADISFLLKMYQEFKDEDISPHTNP